jgi:hypothetical protein
MGVGFMVLDSSAFAVAFGTALMFSMSQTLVQVVVRCQGVISRIFRGSILEDARCCLRRCCFPCARL